MSAADTSTPSEDDDTADDNNHSAQSTFGGIYLGAHKKPCSFDDIARTNQDNDAFTQFHARFTKRLVGLFAQDDSPITLKTGSVLVQGSEQVSPALVKIT
jgi:hypothetical protein